MDLKLEGKVALVTGGGRDVGREIALTLAKEGATVAVNYNRSAIEAERVVRDIEVEGGRAKSYKADIGDYEAVKIMTASVVADFGRIDILINNAGYVKVQKFLDSGPEDWKPQIDACLYGAIHCCRAAAPYMVEQNSGRIISLIGDSSRIGEANISMAAATRAGTMALGKSLAKELGRNNITVNTVSLGLVQTSHSDASFLEKNMDKIVRNYPLRRIGAVDDVAPIIAFLASDAASWVTGQTISVNGGFCMV